MHLNKTGIFGLAIKQNTSAKKHFVAEEKLLHLTTKHEQQQSGSADWFYRHTFD